jgi:hypothetical protein
MDKNNVVIFTPRIIIQPTQEVEVRRIAVQSQPRQIVGENLSQKNQSQKSLAE